MTTRALRPALGLVLLGLVPSGLRAQAAATATPPAGDTTAASGCATLVIRRTALDSVAVRLRDDGCGPLAVELVGDSLRWLTGIRDGAYYSNPTITVAVRNRSASALRLPVSLYTGYEDGIVPEQWTPRRDADRVSIPATGEWKPQVDPGPDPVPDVFSYSSWTTRHLPSDAELASDSGAHTLPPGAMTSPVVLPLQIRGSLLEGEAALTVRALHPGPPVPPRAPPTLAAAWLAPEQLVRSASVPRPYAHDLLIIRFAPSTPPSVRQRYVERLGGRVVGGMPSLDGHAEGDYVVQVPDDGTGAGALRACEVAGRWFGPVDRRGVVMVPALEIDSAAVALGARLSPRRSSGRRGDSTGIQVEFAESVAPPEQAAIIGAVGLIPVARDAQSTRWFVLRDSSGAASAARLDSLARRLRLLPGVRQAKLAPPAGAPPPAAVRRSTRSHGDSGQAAADRTVRRFLASLHLVRVRAIRDLEWLPEQDLLFARVEFDSTSSLWLVRHRKRIRVLSMALRRPAGADSAALAAASRFMPRDSVFVDAVAFDSLQGRAAPRPTGQAWRLGRQLADALLRDHVASRELRERFIAELYAGPDFTLMALLESDAVVRRDVRLLSHLTLASAPLRWTRRATVDELRRLAPRIVADPRADDYILLALAFAALAEPADTAVMAALLAHERAGRNIAILTVLASAHPDALATLRRALPPDPVVRAILAGAPTRRASPSAVLATLLDTWPYGHDPVVLSVLANSLAPFSDAVMTEAARRLPAGTVRWRGLSHRPPPVAELTLGP